MSRGNIRKIEQHIKILYFSPIWAIKMEKTVQERPDGVRLAVY
jgi:hypothetical protein